MKKLKLLIITLFAIASTAFAQTDEPDYVCFYEFEEDATITLKKYDGSVLGVSTLPSYTLEYSYDKETWVILDYHKGDKININRWDSEEPTKVYIRGNFKTFWDRDLNSNYIYNAHFSITAPCKCSGNIMTLIDMSGNTTTISNNYTFSNLFFECPIKTAPRLPASVLSYG